TTWLDYAVAQGFSRIALWGHSLGAVKTVYFLSVQDDARVVCAIASSPPRFSYEMYSGAPDGEHFRTAVSQAQALVDTGTPGALVQARVPVQRRLAAGTYVDKYGPNARYDYLAHLLNVRKPLLMTVGSLEADNISFAGLVQDGPSFNSRWSNVDFANIDVA